MIRVEVFTRLKISNNLSNERLVAKTFLKYNFSAVADDVIIVWVKNSAPGAEIDRYLLDDTTDHEKNGGHTVDGLDPVMHQFKFYQSVDGITLNTLLLTLDVDASIYNEIVVQRFTYRVDRGNSGSDPGEVWGDPVAGDDTLEDERLIGATHENCIVEQRGVGPLREDEINFLPGGGFEFVDSGTAFSNDDTFTALYYKVVGQQVQTVQGGGDYNDVKLLQDDVDDSIDFDTTFYKKICVANFTGPVGTIVFPSMAIIPDTKVRFTTHQGSQNYLTLAFNGSETVKLRGQNKNKIHLAKGESIEIVFKDNVGYVDYRPHGLGARGSVIGDYANRSANDPVLLADTSTGLLDGNDYPGLLEYVQALPAGSVVTITNWNLNLANKRKWGYNSITKEIRVPHLDDLHRRFRTGSEDAGTYQADQVGQYTDSTGESEGGTDPINADTYQAGPYKMKNNVRNAGQETRVKAFKEYPLIVL
jgi:hypothetical protein